MPLSGRTYQSSAADLEACKKLKSLEQGAVTKITNEFFFCGNRLPHFNCELSVIKAVALI